MKNKIFMAALAAFTLIGAQLAQADNIYVFDMSALAGQNWELVGGVYDQGQWLGGFDVAESGDVGSTLSVDLYGEILIVVVPDGEELYPYEGFLFTDTLSNAVEEPATPGNYVYDDGGDSTTVGTFDLASP